MERQPVFMDRWHGKCSFDGSNMTQIYPPIIHTFYQNFAGLSEEIYKLILKLIWKRKGPE